MESYLNVLPSEILELIVYQLNNDDLESLVKVIKGKVSWPRVNFYRFNEYKNITFDEYIRRTKS